MNGALIGGSGGRESATMSVCVRTDMVCVCVCVCGLLCSSMSTDSMVICVFRPTVVIVIVIPNKQTLRFLMHKRFMFGQIK